MADWIKVTRSGQSVMYINLDQVVAVSFAPGANAQARIQLATDVIEGASHHPRVVEAYGADAQGISDALERRLAAASASADAPPPPGPNPGLAL